MSRFRMLPLGVLLFIPPCLVLMAACSFGLSAEEFTGGRSDGGVDSVATNDAANDGVMPFAEASADADANNTTTSITRGIIARWSFDEPTGLVAKDSVGTNHGNLLVGPDAGAQVTHVAGVLGGALAFAGGASIEVPYHPSLGTIAADFTVTFWANAGAAVGAQPRLLAYLDRFDVKLNGRGPQLSLAGRYAIAGWDLPNDQWHHLGVVFEKGFARWYVDGLLVALGSNDFNGMQLPGQETSPARIATSSSQTSPYTGMLDDVRVYGVALTAAEMAAIAAER